MPVRPASTFRALPFVTLLLAGGASAAETEWTCPFAPPPDRTAEVVPTENAPIRFEGTMMSASSPHRVFAVYDPLKRQSFLLEIDGENPDYKILGYDEERGVIRISYQGRVMQLSLAQAKTGLPGASGLPPSGPTSFRYSPVQAQVGTAANAQQLKDIADQVKIRRQLRAAPQANPPVSTGSPGR